MAGPVLLVELPTANTTRSEAAALVQACTEGLGAGRCELSSSSEPAAGVAVVSLRGPDALSALVEVGSRRGESSPWRSQELTFQPRDARVERFRTLGFAIATLYRETRAEAPREGPRPGEEKAAIPATPVEKSKPPSEHRNPVDDAGNTRSAKPSRERAGQRPHGWISAGPIGGYDHELASPFRWGGQLALGAAPLDLPLFVNLSGAYAVGKIPEGEASPPISLSWATVGVGGGGYLPLVEDLQVRLSLQGVLVQLGAHGSEPDQGQQESERWLLGGQAGVELVGWGSRRWGVTLGSQVQQLRGATTISVHKQAVATVAALSVQVGAALEFRPFQR